jgi:hypothetical protein
MCDPMTMGMAASAGMSGLSSLLGKKGGGGSVPTPSMPGLQMSPLVGGGGPSGTTPGGSAGGGGGAAPAAPAGGDIFGTGLGTSQMGGLLGKLFGAIGNRGGPNPNLWQSLPPGV